MDKSTFLMLLERLKVAGLTSTRHVCSGEKLMVSLYSLTMKSNRDCQERWQHSGDTISRIVHEVSEIILRIQDECIYMKEEPEISPFIRNNPKFFPYFKDCIGALDGTHIPAVVPTAECAPFRNRKGFLSQNVLAVCNFDMTFSYVLAGWEGSAHDGRVFQDSLDKGIPQREGKSYLGDAGYGLSN